MAAAGLSPIGVVDYDTVDLSNLHRQILHTEQKKVSKVHVLKSPTFVLTVWFHHFAKTQELVQNPFPKSVPMAKFYSLIAVLTKKIRG